MQFNHFVTNQTSRAHLLRTESISRKTLSVRFKHFFIQPLHPDTVWDVLPPSLPTTVWVYGVDGKWLRRQGVVIIHRDITTGTNLYWSYHPSESYAALEVDLKRLVHRVQSNLPSGTVSDWKGAIVSAVSMYLRATAHQRCLTHVVREAKRNLPKHSPYEATRALREIAKSLIHIKTKKEKRSWFAHLIKWEHAYGRILKEKTIGIGTQKKWWYTHGNVRRGWRLLTHDTDPFFVYLDHPFIPHSNNSLEGVIGQAKNKLSNHRGMKTNQQVSFFFWHLIFSRVKTAHDLRKLWAVWRKMKK